MNNREILSREIKEVFEKQTRIEMSIFDYLNENVFGSKIQIIPRDYIYILSQIEEKYKFKITGSDIEKYKLKTLEQVINMVNDKLAEEENEQ